MDVCPRYLLSNQIPFEIGSTKCDPALTCFLPSHSFASHVSFWDDKKRKLVQQNVRNHTSWCKQWWDGINKVFILSEELGTISVYGKRYHLTQTAILFKYGMFSQGPNFLQWRQKAAIEFVSRLPSINDRNTLGWWESECRISWGSKHLTGVRFGVNPSTLDFNRNSRERRKLLLVICVSILHLMVCHPVYTARCNIWEILL